MVAARKVEAIRNDLGKVGPVIASQVEQAMLGKRKQLDTDRAEREAQAAARELPIERKLRERVARLHDQLVETREVFHLSPANVRAAVQVALDLARLPALEPIDSPGCAEGHGVPDAGFQGTWARCTEGLAHPHTSVRRPITFDHDVARGRDDVVLVHLNHRLVQMCLRLLRAEVWAPDDVKRMHRVTARVAPDAALSSPAVVVMSRLVVTGAQLDAAPRRADRGGRTDPRRPLLAAERDADGSHSVGLAAHAARASPRPRHAAEDLAEDRSGRARGGWRRDRATE